jgi:8-oxo-dGTP diphosphatase
MLVRATVLIDAPQGAVGRALVRTDIWTRAARALDADAEVAGELVGPRAPLRTGDLIRIRRHPAPPGRRLLSPRSLILRVTIDGAGVPTFELVAGPLRYCLISVGTEWTGGGTLVTVDTRIEAELAPLTPVLRRRVLLAQQTLLGIVSLAAREPVVVVAAAVIANGRVLAARRSRPPELAGKWELPGGKVEPGETDAGALARELVEELGVETTVSERIGGEVDLGDNMVLRCYRAEIVSGRPAPVEHDAVLWLDAGGLAAVDWLDPDREVLAELRHVLLGGQPARRLGPSG